jgi:hypothetical protein
MRNPVPKEKPTEEYNLTPNDSSYRAGLVQLLRDVDAFDREHTTDHTRSDIAISDGPTPESDEA